MRLRARKVTVEERLDGSLHITGDGAGPKYKEGTERPEKQAPAKQPRRSGKTYLPSKDHPLRRGGVLKPHPQRGGISVLTE